jgi:hypothetical protein
VSDVPIEAMVERVLRGYDTAAVSVLVAEVSPALQSCDAAVRRRAWDQLQRVELRW